MSFYDRLVTCFHANLRRLRTTRLIYRERKIEGAKMKTSIDLSSSVFSAGEYKKHTSLTVLAFVVSPGSPILVEDHGFVQGAILFFFFASPSFLSQDHSLLVLPLPLSSQSSRSIINDIHVTQAREILNTVAFLRRLRWEREAGGARSLGPRSPWERRRWSERERASSRRKGRLAGDEGCSPCGRRIYRGEIRRFIEAVRGS